MWNWPVFRTLYSVTKIYSPYKNRIFLLVCFSVFIEPNTKVKGKKYVKIVLFNLYIVFMFGVF